MTKKAAEKQVETVAIDSLEPDPENARVHGSDNLKAITTSLKRFGQARPLVVTADSYWLFARDGSRRKFTIDEIKAICSFPPDYVLTGSYRKAWTRLGNSVPPFLMCAVATTIRDEILAKTES